MAELPKPTPPEATEALDPHLEALIQQFDTSRRELVTQLALIDSEERAGLNALPDAAADALDAWQEVMEDINSQLSDRDSQMAMTVYGQIWTAIVFRRHGFWSAYRYYFEEAQEIRGYLPFNLTDAPMPAWFDRLWSRNWIK